MERLNEKEIRVLSLISRGYGVARIMQEMGLKSKRSITKYYKELERKGYIKVKREINRYEIIRE